MLQPSPPPPSQLGAAQVWVFLHSSSTGTEPFCFLDHPSKTQQVFLDYPVCIWSLRRVEKIPFSGQIYFPLKCWINKHDKQALLQIEMAHYKLCNVTVSGQNNPRVFSWSTRWRLQRLTIVCFYSIGFVWTTTVQRFHKIKITLLSKPSTRKQVWPRVSKTEAEIWVLVHEGCLELFEKTEVNYHIFGSLRNAMA